MHRLSALLIATLLFVTSGGTAAAAGEATAPSSVAPISVASFAKLPFIERPALSPDGRSIAGLFSVNGTQVIGVKPLFDTSRAFRAVTVPETMQVDTLRWVNDRTLIAKVRAMLTVETDRWYVTRLIAIDTTTGTLTKLLWNLAGQNGGDIVWMPSDGSSEILVAAQGSIYLGQDFWPSVYRVDVTSGQSAKVVRGREGVSSWYADAEGTVRSGIAYSASNRTFRLLYRDTADASFRVIDAADTRRRQVLITPFQFEPGTTRALVVHDDDKGRSALYETDLLTRKDIRTLFVMPEGSAEVDYPVVSTDGTTLLGAATTRADERIVWIDPALADLQAQFDKAVVGRARIVSFSQDRKRMLVEVAAPAMPGFLYYYDVDDGVLHKITELHAGLAGSKLSPVTLVHYRSRDGMDIEGLLTLPRGVDPKQLPFIVLPHGGPWAQDTLSYDYLPQFLAAKGYAVLQPNYRGSTGYGTMFLRAGEGQLGLAMQDDVTDAVRWAVAEGVADTRRVCIVGASYGGYAAMWGVAREPDLYRCAVSIAGVANLRREVNDFGDSLMGGKFQDDWKRMTPDFDVVSPINAVDRIKAPLLLIHGKRDVTVDVSQSTRMFARMRAAGKTVDFVPLPLADHYFTREADRVTLLTSIGAFLDKYNPATPQLRSASAP